MSIFTKNGEKLAEAFSQHWYIDMFSASCKTSEFPCSLLLLFSLFFLTFLLVFLLRPPLLFSSVYTSLSSSCLLGWSWPQHQLLVELWPLTSHPTLQQRKKHYWRLDCKCIILFQNDTTNKYYKVESHFLLWFSDCLLWKPVSAMAWKKKKR